MTSQTSNPRRRSLRLFAIAAILGIGLSTGPGVSALQVSASGAATVHDRTDSQAKPTVVLVHGAFADASGWSGVIERLQSRGYTVIAPANPLRGVDSDAAYLRSVLATITG